MRNIVFFVILSVFFSLGCKNKSKESVNFRYIDFKTTPQIEHSEIFDFDNITIIPLETTNESLISDNFTAQLIDSNIFVFDFNLKHILRFNSNGKFLNVIGEVGRGPNEILNAADFYVDSKKRIVEILCEPGSTIKKFSFEGELKSKISFDFPSHSFIKDYHDCYYFYRGVNSGYSNFRLTYTNSSVILNEMLVDPGNPPVGLVMDMHCFVENQNIVYLKETLFNQIISISDGHLNSGYKINFDSKDLGVNDLTEFSGFMDFFKYLTEDGFYSMVKFDILNNRALMHFQYQKGEDELLFEYLYLDLLTDEKRVVLITDEIINQLRFQTLLPNNKFLFTLDAIFYQSLVEVSSVNVSKPLNINAEDNPILIIL